MKMKSFLALVVLSVFLPIDAFAYIGPGAGFAFIGSGFVFILTILTAIFTLAFWPLQWVWRRATGKRISKDAKARRVIVLGLDGLEPSLVDRYISEGKLPNLKKLSQEGAYKRLGTTLPALSPVAWSSFQTGVNPGAHNIFDFLTRDKRLYLPHLSSTEVDTSPPAKLFGFLKLGRGKQNIRILRKSQPFWKILGNYGIFSNVIRVPISYPPEKFNGNVLSAMCTPDLRGTQGAFSAYTTKQEKREVTEGEIVPLRKKGDLLEGELMGPPDPSGEPGKFLAASFTLKINREKKEATLEIGETTLVLAQNSFSPWVTVDFQFGFRKSMRGICRFCLRETEPEVFLYVSPINIDPSRPALPISSPIYFSTYLAKNQGAFGTLGLMEDTWGRNELALDDARFLEQTYLTHDEREKMFLNMLDKTREGVCICVFDASDRIQHMFWRYLDDKHPSPRESAEFQRVIPEMYEKMDVLVGKTLERVRPEDILIVMSDHGFTSFRRCININTWLLKEGLLTLKEGATPGDYLQGVDWNKTKAFGLGLAGIYINRKGRESNGIVEPTQVESVKREIREKLKALRDPQDGSATVREVHDTAKAYKGLYAEEAPDLIVGYEPGYRVSWDSVKGIIEPEIFSDNMKAWSGDHHVDPKCVPGILFMNRKVSKEAPTIIDIAPTVLDIFRVPVPPYMEGTALL